MFSKADNAGTIEATLAPGNIDDANLEQVSGGILPFVVGGLAAVAAGVWLYNHAAEVLRD